MFIPPISSFGDLDPRSRAAAHEAFDRRFGGRSDSHFLRESIVLFSEYPTNVAEFALKVSLRQCLYPAAAMSTPIFRCAVPVIPTPDFTNADTWDGLLAQISTDLIACWELGKKAGAALGYSEAA